MGNETYKRGQVSWAIWQLFHHVRYDDPSRKEPPPAVFLARVKKMWEFGVPIAEEERPGTGITIEYTLHHAFELTIALMLQDMGLKQAEVAFFVRSCRNQLKQFATAPFFPAFLAFRLQEIREGHPLWHSWRGVIIRGAADALRADAAIDELKGLDGDGRVFLELGGIVSRLSDYLQQAPEIRRGRP